MTNLLGSGVEGDGGDAAAVAGGGYYDDGAMDTSADENAPFPDAAAAEGDEGDESDVQQRHEAPIVQQQQQQQQQPQQQQQARMNPFTLAANAIAAGVTLASRVLGKSAGDSSANATIADAAAAAAAAALMGVRSGGGGGVIGPAPSLAPPPQTTTTAVAPVAAVAFTPPRTAVQQQQQQQYLHMQQQPAGAVAPPSSSSAPSSAAPTTAPAPAAPAAAAAAVLRPTRFVAREFPPVPGRKVLRLARNDAYFPHPRLVAGNRQRVIFTHRDSGWVDLQPPAPPGGKNLVWNFVVAWGGYDYQPAAEGFGVFVQPPANAPLKRRHSMFYHVWLPHPTDPTRDVHKFAVVAITGTADQGVWVR